MVAALVRVDLDDDYEAVRSGGADQPTAIELQRMTRDALYERARQRRIEVAHR